MARGKTPPPPPEDFEEKIVGIDVEEEMQNAFLEYSYSVIYSRALPDARDGLKPVQRRILYGANELGLRPDRGHVKSQRVVGEVMGKYHPHGDQAIYDALVRMAQPFTLRLPLIDGHGNFGSLDDGPAAARYTEARMANAALLMVAGLDEDTVDFVPNYDDTQLQPGVHARGVPQPPRQRRRRHRGRHGHEHAPAQPRRGHRRRAAPHRQPDVLARGPHEVRPGARPALRRQDRRPRGHPRRLPHRAWQLPHPRDGTHRVDHAAAQGHRRHRAALPRRTREGHRQGQGPRPGQEAAGHRRPQGPLRPPARPAARHRDQERLQPRRRPRAALQADADGGELRHQQRGARRGPAAHHGPQGPPQGLRRLPHRRGAPAHRPPAGQARGATAPRRGPAHRHRRHRRGHPGHPQLRRRRHRPRPPHGRLRPVRGPGDVHPRPAAAPAHEVLAHRAREREDRARARHRGAARPARQREAAAQARVDRARRRRQGARHPASHGAARELGCQRDRDRQRRRSRSPTTRAGCS